MLRDTNKKRLEIINFDDHTDREQNEYKKKFMHQRFNLVNSQSIFFFVEIQIFYLLSYLSNGLEIDLPYK